MSIIQGTSKTSAAGGHTIEQAIRFNDNDSAYLEKTFASAGNRQIWTWSAWIKLSGSTARQIIFGAAGGPSYISINENATGSAFFNLYNAGWYWETAAKYRDPSAWYHLVWAFDTTNATADNRMRFYVNGSEVTDYSTKHATGSQNASGDINNNVAHRLGRHPSTTHYYDGYLAEINFVDGQQLAPTDFGETNSTTGQWVPVRYTGAYGANGFHITGADSADLGADATVNGNDWTSNGLSSDDAVLDSPTDNFCTLNPLDGAGTLSDGNLVNAAPSASFVNRRMTFGVPSSGKWAFRVKKSANNFMVGVIAPQQTDGDPDQNNIDALYYYDKGGTSSGDLQTRRTGALVVETTNPPAGIAADTFMEVLIDKDNNRLGVVIGGTAYIAVDAGVAIQDTMTQIFVATASSTATVDFGQSGFTPSQTGYKALSTANLPDPTIADPSAYFQTTLYTGNASTQEVNQSGNSTFEPGLVWIKTRSNAASHALFDQVRGVNKQLRSDSSGAEYTVYSDLLTAFDADGFTLGADATVNNVNVNTYTYAAWQWAADGTTGSSNTDGSITSTVSAGTSGFSIVSYTGTGANATVGHGLGVAPQMIIIKNRPDADNWIVYHEAMGATKGLTLNSTAAATTASTFWNNTAPTSSVFSIGSGGGTNGSGDAQIAYCFAEVEGFSKFISYEGNASTDGPFIHCGFRPSFVLIKNIDAAEDWWIQDAAREPFNGGNMARIAPNSSAAEADNVAWFDFVSNGLKVRYNAGGINSSGTHIVMAFAESPFKTATAR